MNRLKVEAELLKIARLLGTTAAELEHLRRFDEHQLRSFRLALTDSLYDEHRYMFRRLAVATKFTPPRLAARLSMRYFGPTFSARIAGELPVERAVALSERMTPEFLADSAAEMDQVVAGRLVEHLSPEKVTAIVEVIAAREDFFTAAALADVMPDDTLRAAFDVIKDDEHLLRTALLIELEETLARGAALLPDDRMRGIVVTVKDHPELWPEALSVASVLPKEQRRLLAGIAAAELGDAVDDLVRAVYRFDLWPQLIRFASVAPVALQRLVWERVLALGDSTRELIEAVGREGLAGDFFEVVRQMSSGTRTTLASRIASIPQRLWLPLATRGAELGYDTEATELTTTQLRAEDIAELAAAEEAATQEAGNADGVSQGASQDASQPRS